MIVTLIGDVATNYFLLRELDLQLEIARRTLRPQRRNGRLFPEPAGRRCVEPARGGSDRRQPRADRRRHPRDRTADRHRRERAVPAARPAAGTDRAEARSTPASARRRPFPPAFRHRCSSGGRTSSQAEQLLVAANADIGAAKALFFPTISLTGFLGGVSGDLTTFLGGEGRSGRSAPGLFQPIFQAGRIRRNLEAMQARFDAALAEYQKAALNGYREVANSLVTIQKLAEVRVQRQTGVTALAGRFRSVARALRFRPRQLHRNPDRRPGPVRTAAPAGADARRRASRAGRAVPNARRRLAAVDEGRRIDGDKKLKTAEVREGAAAAAGQAVRPAGVGQSQGPARHRRLRGARRGRQGRHDQGDHRAREPTRLPRRGAAGAVRPREEPDVPAALHAALSGGRRDRHLRSQLVQPGRRRARDGLLLATSSTSASSNCARCSRSTSSRAASS